MNMQKLILGGIKRLPSFVVRRMAGAPLAIDGNVLDAHIHLLARQAERQEADYSDLQAMRANIRTMMEVLNAPRRKGVRVRDTHIPGPAGDMAVRIYQPQTPRNANTPLPAILFFHQGGLVVMDLDSCDTFCTIMADICGACVISLDYRLAPEHAFPAAHEDALALWDYVQAHAQDFNIDAARVAVAGDSAGGLLASVACQVLREKGGVQPKAQLLVYPWVSTNLEEKGSLVSCADCFPLNAEVMEFFNAQLFPDGQGMDHVYANPLDNQNLADLPPAIIATAGFDPIRDQGNDYAERLKAAGVAVTHYCFGSLSHSFLTMGNVSHAAVEASEQLARDLANLL